MYPSFSSTTKHISHSRQIFKRNRNEQLIMSDRHYFIGTVHLIATLNMSQLFKANTCNNHLARIAFRDGIE